MNDHRASCACVRVCSLGVNAHQTFAIDIDNLEGKERQRVERGLTVATGLFRLCAESGDANAQFNVGLMYKQGLGVEQSDEECFKWWQLSAGQEFPSAQHNLGAMYDAGKVVERDSKKAAQLYLQALAGGHRESDDDVISLAAYNLGIMYSM